MKNADMPAMPLTGDAYDDFAAYDGTSNTSHNPQCQGLTKREHAAIAAMQGLLARGYPASDDTAREAWLAAYVLFHEQERTS